MQEFQLRRDREAPLVFTGEMLAEVSTRAERPRWAELRLYRTRSGAMVAEEVGKTTVDGECDRHKVWYCHDATDVRHNLGDGSLAKQLYLEAGLDGVESVK